MYNLHLTAEQLEMRDTVREFVAREIKPIALHPDRLQSHPQPFPPAVLKQASQLGLRTLALSEAAGGAGADSLTSCIVTEELAAGDVGVAAVLGQTSMLAHALFDQAMTPEQRARFLSQLVADDSYHLAYAGIELAFDADLGGSYHRPFAAEAGVRLSATRQGNGDWVVNGTTDFVANAPIAKLIAVDVRTDPKATGTQGVSTLLVPRDAPGLTLRKPAQSADGEPLYVWHHGAGGEFVFKDCKVPAANLLGKEGTSALAGGAAAMGRGSPLVQAMDIGVGRAAYEAAVDYAKLRIQGGRPIIEHQAIGTLLAEIAIRLEVARTMVWKAAWAADHPAAYADRSIADLPLQTMARVFTADAMHKVALKAAEVFGAMGVMRDMPLQQYVHDALVFVHAGAGNSVETLKIAEAVAGYERP
jgi:alkylation response protein AidB-like acyl-CoA dehydrogenase